MTDFVHPTLLFILGALPIPFLKGSIRKAYLLLIPAAAIFAVLTVQPGSYGAAQFRKAVRFRVAMIDRVLRGLAQAVDDALGCGDIRVPNGEADDLFTFRFLLGYLSADFNEQVRR